MINNKNTLYKLNIMLFLSLFVFSFQIRGIFFSGNLKSLNILALVSISLLFIYNTKNNIIGIFILIFSALMMFISQYFNNKSIFEIVTVFNCIITPILLMYVNIKKDKFIEIFKLYVKFINVIVLLLIIFAIIDKFTNQSIIKFFAVILKDESFYNAVQNDSENRMYSFMGHPLYNVQIFLIFYVINYCSKKYIEYGINMLLVAIITILGISFCASKTGLVLLFVCLILLRPTKNKWFYPVIFLSIVVISLRLGIFDSVIYRFKTQTLTSGRNEVWDIVREYNLFPIGFWSGYGSGFNHEYNKYLQLASAAFEYPIRLFALEYGVLFSILISINLFIIPIVALCRGKNLTLIVSFLIIFFDVNTYNGIGLGMDIMLMFAVFVYMILNLNQYLNYKKLIKENDSVFCERL